eukprot:CAMPEP_0197194590 /NCGR_PEP_ID=MMETSP1423-20130617/29527_1 /TAXON_ID=476441 /ORGANISM="Pseudo-nitzschia heimii, Strain UNC1101" /LENGTH=671 /DNA_ID=CAMNT_0042648039 /DNA_START=110 /DNA_END=2126 /DNA_ORIENTATION=-
MNKSSPTGVEIDDSGLADDALEDLMHEAETLMHDLPMELACASIDANTGVDSLDVNNSINQGSSHGATGAGTTKNMPVPLSTTDEVPSADTRAAMNVGGIFSIDDDDEDEIVNDNKKDNRNNCDINDDPLRVTKPPVTPPIVQHELGEHPLSTTSFRNTTVNQTTGSYNGASTPTSSMSNIFNGTNTVAGVMNMNVGINMGRRTGSAGEAAVAGMDTISKTTSMFASNLASMAQRGIAQVAAATAPVHAINVMGASGATGPGQTLTHTHTRGSAQPWSNGMKNNVFSNLASTADSRSSLVAAAGANRTVTNSSGYPQLDKDQKSLLLKKHVGDLLQGERVIMFLTNLLHVSDTSGLSFIAAQQQNSVVMWCCVMTYYRLILFSTGDDTNRIEPPNGWDRNCWQTAMPPSTSIRLLEMPLASMDRVEKTVYQAEGSSYMGLVIYGKDCGRIIRFTTPSYADTGRAFESLNTYAFPGRRNLGYLFAFESKRQEVMDSIEVDENSGQQSITLPPTPKRFDPMTEYPRLIKNTAITQPPWSIWASVNATYQLSQSYPSVLVGPSSLDETKPEALSVIRQCSVFRKGQRLPSMAWCGAGGASIWRSSQPKVGLQGNRSPADELYVRHIIESARGANAMAEPPPIYPRSVLEQLTGDYTARSGSSKSDDWVPEQDAG